MEKNIYCRTSKFDEKIFSIFYKSRVLYMKYLRIFFIYVFINYICISFKGLAVNIFCHITSHIFKVGGNNMFY